MTDGQFFDALNLDWPGMQAAKASYLAGDIGAAKSALADYFRKRTKPTYFPLSSIKRDQNTPTEIRDADNACRHIFRGGAVDAYKPVPMGDNINWSLEPVGDREWTWSLNRHYSWISLGLAYLATDDEKYARCFSELLADWVRKNPVLAKSGGSGVPSWRTIEAGIRMNAHWLRAYQLFLQSDSFTTEARILFYKSLIEHARFLMANPSGGNWLTMEMNGLATVGIMFPEFKESGTWREFALTRLDSELNRQVYPDGAQTELTTSYHNVALSNMVVPFKLAKLNGIATPPDYLRNLQKMYEYNLKLMKPNGGLPCLNDSDPSIGSRDTMLKALLPPPAAGIETIRRSVLLEGAELLGRDDMMYAATGGERGTVPGFLSCANPYAGVFVMRSNWDKDARYLAFDAGPFGAGHQHEDKLGFELCAFDRTFIVDPGRYSYADSPFRRFFLGPESHSTIMIDGLGQNRRAKGAKRPYVVKEPLKNLWASNSLLDYAEGFYDEGYGPDRAVDAVHRRQVIFVKPDYWVIVDRVLGAGEHTISSMFHFTPGKLEVDADACAVHTLNSGGPNLDITGFSPAARLSVSKADGQTSPVQGWVATTYGVKEPAPVATFTVTSSLPASIAYVLQPRKIGSGVVRVIGPAPKQVSPDPTEPLSMLIGGDMVVVQTSDVLHQVQVGSVETDARAFVEREHGKSIATVGATNLRVTDSVDLKMSSAATTDTCEIVFGKDAVRLDGSGLEGKIKLAGGSEKALPLILNGKTYAPRTKSDKFATVSRDAVSFRSD